MKQPPTIPMSQLGPHLQGEQETDTLSKHDSRRLARKQESVTFEKREANVIFFKPGA